MIAKPMTFDEWKEENLDLINALEAEAKTADVCGHCGGTGEHECDCGNAHECNYCVGTGKEDGISGNESYLRKLYESKRDAEFAKLSRWGTKPISG